MFRFTTAGESHGRALVAIVEGLPAGVPVDIEQIDHELARRVPVVDLAIIGVERGKVAGDFGSEDQVPPS